MCGAVAGPNLNFDTALDVAFAVKALIDPSLKLTGYTSADEANAQWTAGGRGGQGGRGRHRGRRHGEGAVHRSPGERTVQDADLRRRRPRPRRSRQPVESLLTALAFGTAGRYELEQRVGGNPSDNTDATTQADLAGGGVRWSPPSVGTSRRCEHDAGGRAARRRRTGAPRQAFEALGDTTGDISVPTLTMHTEDDPLVLVPNETVLAQRARAQAATAGNLVQLYVAPPATYTETTGAPYGAGHCNFSDQQRRALITTLDSGCAKGVYPVPAGVREAVRAGPGPGVHPSAWPSAPATRIVIHTHGPRRPLPHRGHEGKDDGRSPATRRGQPPGQHESPTSATGPSARRRSDATDAALGETGDDGQLQRRRARRPAGRRSTCCGRGGGSFDPPTTRRRRGRARRRRRPATTPIRPRPATARRAGRAVTAVIGEGWRTSAARPTAATTGRPG